MPARKRDDADLWIANINSFGWVCIDASNNICGIPWGVPFDKVSKLPPAGEWVSKKEDIMENDTLEKAG